MGSATIQVEKSITVCDLCGEPIPKPTAAYAYVRVNDWSKQTKKQVKSELDWKTKLSRMFTLKPETAEVRAYTYGRKSLDMHDECLFNLAAAAADEREKTE